MDVGIDKEKLLHYKALAARHLSDPMKLRLAVVFALLCAAIGAVYLPLSKRIEEGRRELAAERSRHQAVADVEKLRRQVQAYRDRIGNQADTNEWVQYILDGMRGFQVKLRDMESKEPRAVGPYLAVSLTMEIEGTYPRLKSFVEWLESSRQLLRVDSIRFEKRPDSVLMKVLVLGLSRKNAPVA